MVKATYTLWCERSMPRTALEWGNVHVKNQPLLPFQGKLVLHVGVSNMLNQLLSGSSAVSPACSRGLKCLLQGWRPSS